MPLLELKDISFSYKKTEVIKGLSLSVERGEFATLLGESGCGKTTVLRLISGFLNPNQGKILINGKEIGVESKKIISFLLGGAINKQQQTQSLPQNGFALVY